MCQMLIKLFKFVMTDEIWLHFLSSKKKKAKKSLFLFLFQAFSGISSQM